MRSSIEWTDATWNPQTGCTRTSRGCRNCYAITHAQRLSGNPHPTISGAYAEATRRSATGELDWTGTIQLLPDRLEIPLQVHKPTRFFVNSMTDLFHEAVPEAWIGRVFDVMCRAPWHQFQILTKRSERLAALAHRLPWPQHIWMGVSIEDDANTYRADHLRTVPARIRFISAEPLLSPLPHLNLNGIDWVIAGGESGRRARPMDAAWVRELRDRCAAYGVAFFFKQWGGREKKLTGRVLDGRTWDEYPEAPCV